MAERNFIKYRNNKIHEVGRPESYVTSEYLYDLIRSGGSIRIVLDDTQEDITSLVMARLLYDKIRTKKLTFDPSALSRFIVNSYRAQLRKE